MNLFYNGPCHARSGPFAGFIAFGHSRVADHDKWSLLLVPAARTLALVWSRVGSWGSPAFWRVVLAHRPGLFYFHSCLLALLFFHAPASCPASSASCPASSFLSLLFLLICSFAHCLPLGLIAPSSSGANFNVSFYMI